MQNLLFSNLNEKISISEKDFNKFLLLTETKRIKKKDFLVQQGNFTKYTAFIVSGAMYSYILDTKGEKHVVNIALENYWISDLYGFLSGKSALFNVQSIEDTTCYLISRENIQIAFRQIPNFETFFRLLIQNAYIHSQKRIAGVYSKSARERYVCRR